MELSKFKKDLKALKTGEKLVLGYFIFYKDNKYYYVYNSETKKIENDYLIKDWLYICNDYRFSIEKHSDKPIKRVEKLALKSRFTEENNEKTN
jgi:hypothetical protein